MPKVNEERVAEATDDTAISLDDIGVNVDTGSPYFDDDTKQYHIDHATRFNITAVDADPKATYGPRHLVWLMPVEESEQEYPMAWSFSDNSPARAAQLDKLKAQQEAAGGRPIGPVVVVSRGRARTIISEAQYLAEVAAAAQA